VAQSDNLWASEPWLPLACANRYLELVEAPPLYLFLLGYTLASRPMTSWKMAAHRRAR